ncbi:MAG: 23S rRNA (uracil(1939)-C(5))-methyltransferase RlmD [Coriobacteriia bacterium]|nr:23S rRNA (uracil(1939)-C(5))-methyltransferase RlmD [Coriobacteriia bacterium]
MQIRVERLAYGGDGIGRLEDGRTAFIKGGCPGDLVDVHIDVEHARYAKTTVMQVIEPSSDRIAPPCPYFGTCGGCQWQHVSYDAQLMAKRSAVAEALHRIGHQDVTVDPCVPSARQYGYRNKIELVAHLDANGLTIGYMRAGTNEVVRVDSCLLMPERAHDLPKSLAGCLRYLSGRADLRILRVGARVASATRDLEIALWTTPGAFPRKMVAETIAQATKASGVVRVLARDESAKRSVVGVEVLRGNGAWRERVLGNDMLISAPSFFQVNTPTAEELVTRALEALDADGSDRVLDLYSGAGTFTLPLSEIAGEVVAVEESGAALSDLRRNLERANLWAEIAPGDAERALPNLGRFDLALVDPPRSGMRPGAISALAATGARRIVYVSCDPATLARDCDGLTKCGYHLTRAIPVDLFPQTYHVETIAVLDKT